MYIDYTNVDRKNSSILLSFWAWRCEFHPWVRKIPCRRQWQPTPGFLLGKPQAQRSLVGYSPWGHKRVRHDWATRQQQLYFWDGLFYPVGLLLIIQDAGHSNRGRVCLLNEWMNCAGPMQRDAMPCSCCMRQTEPQLHFWWAHVLTVCGCAVTVTSDEERNNPKWNSCLCLHPAKCISDDRKIRNVCR